MANNIVPVTRDAFLQLALPERLKLLRQFNYSHILLLFLIAPITKFYRTRATTRSTASATASVIYCYSSIGF